MLTQHRLNPRMLCPLSPAHCAQGLKDVVKELLFEFAKANGNRKPARIIFFRDGVSEGEFRKVMHASCLSSYSKRNPDSRTAARLGQGLTE